MITDLLSESELPYPLPRHWINLAFLSRPQVISRFSLGWKLMELTIDWCCEAAFAFLSFWYLRLLGFKRSSDLEKIAVFDFNRFPIGSSESLSGSLSSSAFYCALPPRPILPSSSSESTKVAFLVVFLDPDSALGLAQSNMECSPPIFDS